MYCLQYSPKSEADIPWAGFHSSSAGLLAFLFPCSSPPPPHPVFFLPVFISYCFFVFLSFIRFLFVLFSSLVSFFISTILSSLGQAVA
jgi:hypothetical protein